MIEGRAAILAVPLGCLQAHSPVLEPALPGLPQQMLGDKLACGQSQRVSCQVHPHTPPPPPPAFQASVNIRIYQALISCAGIQSPSCFMLKRHVSGLLKYQAKDDPGRVPQQRNAVSPHLPCNHVTENFCIWMLQALCVAADYAT